MRGARHGAAKRPKWEVRPDRLRWLRGMRAGRRAYGRGIEGRKTGALELRLYMRLRLRGEDASCIRRNPVHSRVAAATRAGLRTRPGAFWTA